MSAAEIETRPGSVASQAHRAIDQLTVAGYVQEITGRKKNRVWPRQRFWPSWMILTAAFRPRWHENELARTTRESSVLRR